MKVRVLKTFEGAYQGLVRPVNSREAEQLGQELLAERNLHSMQG